MEERIYDILAQIVTAILFIASIVLLFMGNYMPAIVCALLFIGTRINGDR